MPYCPNCGAPVKAGERYCFSCGTKIVPVGESAGQNTNFGNPEYCEGCPENNTNRDDERLKTPGFGSNEYDRDGYERERMANTDKSELDERNRRVSYDSEEMSRREGMARDYESQERYRRGEEMAPDQPLPPPAGVPQEQIPGQIPPQQPPVMVRVPAKPKRSFLSSVAKILEILVYLGFIGAALAAIYLLYQFADSIPGI
ncbi:MAG: hypothetical protein DRN71_05600 [Candidatus Nanohalarchaeota archaeon]|nr:MAG: hypothetical protein DRN71_05600 [Candidatus Nanohaloarchaeota archaeon]